MADDHIPYPLDDLRRDMAIRLAVAPPHLLRNVADTKRGVRDAHRAALATYLTGGWEELRITKRPPRGPSFNPNVPAREAR